MKAQTTCYMKHMTLRNDIEASLIRDFGGRESTDYRQRRRDGIAQRGYLTPVGNRWTPYSENFLSSRVCSVPQSHPISESFRPPWGRQLSVHRIRQEYRSRVTSLQGIFRPRDGVRLSAAPAGGC